ncbi:MAG: glycoside hydrolase family 3 N-terminal domain-containing protein [Terracidiphilus sp.]|nr:glycoside hydrolase family 3 N-terminal domain-containing protein [Terracidiphilus sp.]
MFCLSRLLWAQTQKEASQNDAMETKIHQLIEKMTIEEEAGQLTLEPAGPIHGTDFKPSHTDMDILAGKVGALEGSIGISTANYYQHLAIEKSRLHIPLMFGLNVVHGYRTVFPVPLAMAGTFDPELVRSATAFSAAEARADGVTWTNAPMVDIARDGRWGRIVEGAGPDPYLGAIMARAYVQGFQQDDLSKPTALASCTKHYAAYGAPIGGKDYYAVDMSELMLRQDYLPPYRAAVDAGTACIMASFNSLNGIPMHANPYLLKEILRKEWGFRGFVISDANGISELVNHGTAVDGEDAARQALLSGVDMDLGALAFEKQIPKLVRQGRIPKAVLDEAVAHVLRIKYKLGLFDHPYVDDSHTTIMPSAEGRALALHVAEESAVLLKNDAIGGGAPVLPLSPQNRSVALIGPLADSKGNMLGSWAGNGKAEDAVTLRAALEERLHGNLHYAQGTEIESQDETGFAAAVKAAQDSDVAILALGEAASKTGEASSRAFLDLPGNQQKLFEAIARTGRPIILILFSGHPLVLTPVVHHAQAIVEAWYPGIEGGHALANLLYGETNPNGKLTVDLPRSVGQEPLFYMQMPTGRPVRNIDLSHFPAGPSERFTARYLDEQNTGLYPFGWGLSYTTFSYSEPKVERQNDASFLVTVHVKNTGTRTGTEVAQLYLGSKGGSIEQPLRLLKGFQRVTLRAGEDRRVQFTLGPEELSMYNATLKRVVEPILYDIWVGGSSLAQEHVQLDLRGTKEIQLDQD